MAEQERFEVDLPAHDNWTLVKIRRGGGLAVLAVNDGVRSFKQRGFFPWHLTISIQMVETGEGHLPTPQEEEILAATGQPLEQLVLGDSNAYGEPNALYLARSSWNAIRELVFRVHDAETMGAVLSAATQQPIWQRHWSYTQERDDDWARVAPYVEALARK